MSKKKDLGIGVALVAAALMVTLLGCPTGGEDGGGGGTIDPITAFPEPSSYTTWEINVPNPLKSWEGTTVTREDWPKRAAQLGQIMAHYEQGYLPSGGTITTALAVTRDQAGYTAGTQQGAAEVTVSKDGAPAPTKIAIQFFLPDPAAYPPPANGYPVVLVMSNNVGNFAQLAIRQGIAAIGVNVGTIDRGDNETGSYTANARSGVVSELYTYDWPTSSRTDGREAVNGRYEPPYITGGDPDAPSLMITQTWGISRIIDALEIDNAKPAVERLINVDPKKIAITGISRMGKLAYIAGAFEPRIAVVNPVSSGAGGVVLERFTGAATTEAQSLGDAPSMGGSYFINKRYYYVKVEDVVEGTYKAKAVLPADALVNPSVDLDGGNYPGSEYPDGDWQLFSRSGNVKVAPGEVNPLGTAINGTLNTTSGLGHGDNIKPGYAVISFGLQTGAGVEQGWNQGTQNFTDARWGYRCWFSPRFHQWEIPAKLYNVDLIKRYNRGEYGWLPQTPFDQHFLAGMIAPRALLIQDGYVSNNTNPEGTYFGYLASREIYRFLGVPEKIGLNMHLINHANPLREILELGEFMTATLSGSSLPAKFHEQPFPLNDPRNIYDYKKLDWSGGGTTIKAQAEAAASTATAVYAN